MKNKELVCIKCPRGCKLFISNFEHPDQLIVEGNQCPRGEQYAVDEIVDPKRTITATIKLISETERRLPIRTDGEIPKKLYKEIVDEINKMKVTAPIKRGQVLVENIKDTGIDLISTKAVRK